MNITNKGKKWEFAHSIWILWSFTLGLACVGFFWIGGCTGKRKWIIAGLIYLITNFVLILIAEQIKETNNILYNIFAVISFIGFFAAIIHSFMSRKEFLLRLEAVLDLQNATKDVYRNEVRKDYFGDNEKSVQQSQIFTKTQDTPPPQTPAQKINLNDCSEQELTSLPGVGVALAKKAVEIRTQIGNFPSVQDFCERLELMPHFAGQIENFAFVMLVKSQAAAADNKGRVVDI